MIIRILLFLLVISNVAYGATYYVCETATGDESGSSYANCMDIADHNADTYTGGDLIYLCGTITSILTLPSSGSDGSPIVYDGDCSGGAAIIDGQDTSDSSGNVRVTGKSYITIQNMTMKDCDLAGNLLRVSERSHHVIIDNVDFSLTEVRTSSNRGLISISDVYDIEIKNCDFTGPGPGIYGQSNVSNHYDVYNISIHDNVFHDMEGTLGRGTRFHIADNGIGSGTNTEGVWHDIQIYNNNFARLKNQAIWHEDRSEFHTAGLTSYNIDIVDNVIFRSRLYSINWAGISDRSGTKNWSNISRNHMTEGGYDVNGNPDATADGNNCLSAHLWNEVIIEKNYINKCYSPDSGDGSGIILDHGTVLDTPCDNVIIRYNYIVDATNKGISLYRGQNSFIYGNIIINSGYGIRVTSEWSENNVIVNNVLYGNDEGIRHVMQSDTQTIQNNIFLDNGYGIWAGNTPSQLPTETYNLFYNSTTSHIYQDVVGASSIDSTSIDDDPDFTVEGSDFSLQSTSPALDAGIDPGVGYRDVLHPESTWPDDVRSMKQTNLFNMGAYGTPNVITSGQN